MAGHLSGAPLRSVRRHLRLRGPLRSGSVSTPFQLTVDQLQQRLGRLGQMVGVGRAQLIAVQEDVADPFQFAGRYQRPAVKQLPDGYGSKEGIGFVGYCVASMVCGCSSSSNAGRRCCDAMGQE